MNDLFVFQNPNPAANRTEDCVIRAICILEDMDWLTCYWKLCYLGAQMYIVPNNHESVVRALLLQLGYKSNSLPVMAMVAVMGICWALVAAAG
jgi:hypothetical protein